MFTNAGWSSPLDFRTQQNVNRVVDPSRHRIERARSGGRYASLADFVYRRGESFGAANALPAGPFYDIDVIDPDPLCQCRFSSYVGRFIRSPSFSKQPAEFLRFLAKLIRERGYDVLFPTHEQVYLLSRFRDAFTPHIGLALPEFRRDGAHAKQGRVQPAAHRT